MELGDHGAPAHMAGSRYCRSPMRRGRGAAGRTALTVRHGENGLVLLERHARTAAAPGRRGRSWRGPLTFATATAVLVLAAALLLTGAAARPTTSRGPCPARTSTAAYTDGHLLLVRVEPSDGTTALVHLCADRTIGPVSAWSVRLGDNGPSPAGPIAVLRVAEGVALAAAPLTAGRRTRIAVLVTEQTGHQLSFTAQVTAG